MKKTIPLKANVVSPMVRIESKVGSEQISRPPPGLLNDKAQ